MTERYNKKRRPKANHFHDHSIFGIVLQEPRGLMPARPNLAADTGWVYFGKDGTKRMAKPEEVPRKIRGIGVTAEDGFDDGLSEVRGKVDEALASRIPDDVGRGKRSPRKGSGRR